MFSYPPLGAGEGIADTGVDKLSLFRASSRFIRPSSGAAYAVNGFRNNFDFCFCGAGLVARDGNGLDARFMGRKLAGSICTKFDGNTPTCLLRYNLPVHHCPSPAFNASIKSPSINPKSLFDSPLKEYIAFVHTGNRVGIPGAVVAMMFMLGSVFCDKRMCCTTLFAHQF